MFDIFNTNGEGRDRTGSYPVTLLMLFYCMQIAMKELRMKKIPFTIRRYMPDGRYVLFLVTSLLEYACCTSS